MKMNDLFNLPVKHGDFVLLAVKEPTDVEMDKAAIHAINMHDELVEMLEKLTSDVVGFDFYHGSGTLNDVLDLIEKAKGDD